MAEERKHDDDCDISNEKLKSLARTILPLVRAYLSSDEGRKDYAEWQAQRQLNKENSKETSC